MTLMLKKYGGSKNASVVINDENHLSFCYINDLYKFCKDQNGISHKYLVNYKILNNINKVKLKDILYTRDMLK